MPSTADYIELVERPANNNRFAQGGHTINDIMSRYGMAALSIAVIKDYKIHWAKAYGISNLVKASNASPSTLFQAASLSKPVTAMAVLKAIEKDRFGLHDDVTKLMPWPVKPSNRLSHQAITPLMLMSHSAGLGDGYGYPGYLPSAPLPTLDQLLKGELPCNVAAVEQVREPMAASQYSGASYSLLQKLLQLSYNKSFEDLMEELILRPLGMNHSCFQQPLPGDKTDQAAQAADTQGNALPASWRVYPELAAAGLWTTASDLAKFLIEVQLCLRGASTRVLQQTTMQWMANPVGVGSFAAGFAIARHGEGWYLQHHGDNWGYKNWMCGHKTKGYGCILLSTGENAAVGVKIIKTRIEQAYSWDSLDSPLAH